MEGYLVYAVSDSAVFSVVDDSDQSVGFPWSMIFNDVPGITETSTNPPDNCDGATNGSCNTGVLFSFYEGGQASPASDLCFQIPSDNTGPVAPGTWYLPAICELGIFTSGAGGTSANCPANTPNIATNLYSLGFLPELSLNGRYWSSTESSADPTNNAWFQEFFANGVSTQGNIIKSNTYGVRCARVFGLS